MEVWRHAAAAAQSCAHDSLFQPVSPWVGERTATPVYVAFIAIYANAHRRHVYALVVGPKFLKVTSCNHRIRIAALIANDRAYRAY